MRPVTVDEVAEALGIKTRSARARLASLAKAGKAVLLNKPAPKRPALYYLRVSLMDLKTSQYDLAQARAGKINYKKFCSDPFKLTEGSR